jgi:N-acetylglucosaminyl-diphospho-decaprenol L-rhamnosyltransferase
MPSVDIVIIDFNAGSLLKQCLESIERNRSKDVVISRVVLVDNASTPASREFTKGLDLPFCIIRNPRNKGFAAASNQGAKESDADYLLFLNPDTSLDTNSLKVPICFMEEAENARVGICGIQLVDKLGHVNKTCARFPTLAILFTGILGISRIWPRQFPTHVMDEWNHDDTRRVDQVMGAFFLTRRTLFEELGGFDERFFVYYEEVDFSFRAYNMGWTTYYVAGAKAYHKGGGTSEHVLPERLYYSLRSRIHYTKKHFSCLEAFIITAGTFLIEPVTRLLLAMLRGSPRSLVTTLKAYSMLWPGFLESRTPKGLKRK